MRAVVSAEVCASGFGVVLVGSLVVCSGSLVGMPAGVCGWGCVVRVFSYVVIWLAGWLRLGGCDIALRGGSGFGFGCIIFCCDCSFCLWRC